MTAVTTPQIPSVLTDAERKDIADETKRTQFRNKVIALIKKGKTHRQIRRDGGYSLEYYLKM